MFKCRLAEFVLALGIFLVTSHAAVTARPLDEVVASKVLRIAVYIDNAPFSWKDGESAKGIDVDIGKALARRLGVSAEIITRMTGESVDDDLRFNIWKGPVGEGGIADVMLHVPVDRELMARNNLAVIGNTYFEQHVALAIDSSRVPRDATFEIFRKEKVGVQFSTSADYFLMRFDDGALINNVVHYTNVADGVRQFLSHQTVALLGVKSNLEGVLHDQGHIAVFIEPPMPGITLKSWKIGTAVKENSRDLGYAIGRALDDMRADGELERICASYGVTFTPPSAD